MKNTFSFLSSVSIALVLFPVTALAQNINVSVRESSNWAVVSGSNNTIDQKNSQSNVQNNFGSSDASATQRSIQRSHNRAAVSGNNNVIHQNSRQLNIQNRSNVNNYYNSLYFSQ